MFACGVFSNLRILINCFISFQVLFCRLTQEQRELYQQYLDSSEVQAILAGNYKVCVVFSGLYPEKNDWSVVHGKICLSHEAMSMVKFSCQVFAWRVFMMTINNKTTTTIAEASASVFRAYNRNFTVFSNISVFLKIWLIIAVTHTTLTVGLIRVAQLVEHCTGIAEVMASNRLQAWIFLEVLISQLIKLCISAMINHIFKNMVIFENTVKFRGLNMKFHVFT